MSKLTGKQENFCIAYVETGNASEAYRRAYNAENMKPETINRNAKAMLDDNKIATRINELQKPAVEAAQITLEGHLNRLRELSDAALADGQYAAAITAEHHRGKAAGFYINRNQNDNQHSFSGSVSELMKELDGKTRGIPNS